MSQKKPRKKKTSSKKKTKQGRSDIPVIESLPPLQSMESLLAGFGGGGRKGRSSLDEAQEIMKDAEKLYKQYENDGMAVWTYSRALLDFRKHRESPTADKSLRAALERNKHVPLYLLGRKKPPINLPDHYGIGDQNEAVLYASENREAWRSTPGALEWLAAKVK